MTHFRIISKFKKCYNCVQTHYIMLHITQRVIFKVKTNNLGIELEHILNNFYWVHYNQIFYQKNHGEQSLIVKFHIF